VAHRHNVVNRPPADQWKLAIIKPGHGGKAMLRSHDYVTT